jgi:gas vesicle protein
MSNENGGYGFVAGFFLGAALGAVTALLFAPMTGRELQDSIAEERRKLREKTDRAIADLRERGEQVLDRTRKAASQTAEGVSRARDTMKGGGSETET